MSTSFTAPPGNEAKPSVGLHSWKLVLTLPGVPAALLAVTTTPAPYAAEANTGSPGLPPGSATLVNTAHSCAVRETPAAFNVRVTSVLAATKSVASLPSSVSASPTFPRLDSSTSSPVSELSLTFPELTAFAAIDGSG